MPQTVDAGQPLESTVGTLLRLHGARVVVDRTHAPPRRGRDRGRAAVFGLALTCADLEPVDNAAIEADDEQRPDVDADGHVSALLRASAGRATLRAAAATLDEHQPGGGAATEDAGLLGMDVAPLRALVAAVAPAPAPARRIAPALAGAPRDASARPGAGPLAGAPDAAELAPAPPDAADAGLAAAAPAAAPRDAPGPADARPGRADARDGGAPRRGAARGRGGRGGRGRGVALLARGARARAVARAAPAPAARRPRAGPKAARARAKRRPISILPLRYDPRKRAAPEPAARADGRALATAGGRADGGALAAPARGAPAPTAALWQRWPAAPEPVARRPLWQRWPTAEEAVPVPAARAPGAGRAVGATAARRVVGGDAEAGRAVVAVARSATRREGVGQDEAPGHHDDAARVQARPRLTDYKGPP